MACLKLIEWLIPVTAADQRGHRCWNRSSCTDIRFTHTVPFLLFEVEQGEAGRNEYFNTDDKEKCQESSKSTKKGALSRRVAIGGIYVGACFLGLYRIWQSNNYFLSLDRKTGNRILSSFFK
jgi:hypothetical protein